MPSDDIRLPKNLLKEQRCFPNPTSSLDRAWLKALQTAEEMFCFVGSLVQKSIKRATAFLEAGHLIGVVCTKTFPMGKRSFLASILGSPDRIAFPLSVHLYKNLSIEQRAFVSTRRRKTPFQR